MSGTRTPRFSETSDVKIGWARFTWNPVTGCRAGCPWCYARDLANSPRLRPYYPTGFEPTLWEDALPSPLRRRPPRTQKGPGDRAVFVSSMGDLLGVGVPDEWVSRVLDVMGAATWWRFLVLTKQPHRLASFSWPSNVWLGTSLTGDAATPDPRGRAQALGATDATVRFVSFEPLQAPIPEDVLDLGRIGWVIVGGRSAAGGYPAATANPEALDALLDGCDRRGLPVFEKQHARPGDAPRRREWPEPELVGVLA